MPGCITFRDTPLEHEEQMRIMFDAISVTNETSFVPSSGAATVEGGVDGNIEVDREGPLHISPANMPNSAKRAATSQPTSSPKGKKKKNFKETCMRRLVEAYEKKVESSNNSATSHPPVDTVREEIATLMTQVVTDGAEEGSDEHYYATQLLKNKENRDMFITFKTSNGRINWLRRAWEDK